MSLRHCVMNVMTASNVVLIVLNNLPEHDANRYKLGFMCTSGLTVTADVRHSYVMKRQYLNVLFTPTASYKGHTEGLCGVMDNDPSNDLKGPNGEQHDDPIKFSDSCK